MTASASQYPEPWSTDESGPAFVVDVGTASVVAANAPARAMFGLARDAILPFALDSAMPGLAQLRSLARDTTAQWTRERLTLWCNGRPLTLTCDVAVLKNGSDSRRLFSVKGVTNAMTAKDSEPVHAPATDAQPAETLATKSDELPPIARSDAETLKEIARHIREGQSWVRPLAANPLPEPEPQQEPDPDISNIIEMPPELQQETQHAAPPNPAPIPLLPRSLPRALAPGDLQKLAHELKTPLTAIASASEIMRDERLGAMGNATYLGYAADIHNSAAHALAVISTMLTANAAGDDQAGRVANIDLNDLVANVISTMQPLADEHGLTLDFDPEDGAPVVTASATAVRQILLNLLTNAMKFTPEGGDVRAVTGYLPDGSVFLVVRDTGIGMNDTSIEDGEETAEAILPTHANGGHGIGLPLVHQLAAEMGAEVEIDSAPGKGTVVLLAFPKPGSL